MFTYTWKINSFRKRNEPYLGPPDTGLVNVIVSADWSVIGTDSIGNFSEYRTTSIFRPQSDGFIPYENLTEETILNWIRSNLTQFDYSVIDESIIRDIDDTASTVTVKSNKFPWNYS